MWQNWLSRKHHLSSCAEAPKKEYVSLNIINDSAAICHNLDPTFLGE
jgi:hypothetical protein